MNDRKLCAGFGLVFVFFAVVLGVYAGRLTFEEPQSASFVLESAEYYARTRGRGHNIHALRLYGTEDEYYRTEDGAMKFSEIQEALEFLQPGMQMDVLVGADGLRQIVADGQMILSKESTAERTVLWLVLYWCVDTFFLIMSVYALLRIIALTIKKTQGLEFLTREVFSNSSGRVIMQTEL